MNPSDNMKYVSQGLSEKEVAKSRANHGTNRLSPPKRPSVWMLYLDKWKDPVIQILLLAAVLSLIIGIIEGQYIETVGIMLAVFLATGIGFYFEYDAARKFEALGALANESEVKVMRDGKVIIVAQSEVVVGDVVLLECGDEVPADGVLVRAENLVVDESSLTGESSCRKSIESEKTADAAYATNRMLRSSMVLEGSGTIVVDAVGDNTEIGHVAKWAAAESDVETPLNQQLQRLVKVINKFSLTIAILVFVICTWVGISRYFDIVPSHGIIWMDIAQIVLHNFMLAVTLIVMAVPEGLPMAVTLSLALNMRRMLKTNNLVRKMHACETMGAITVICTDKTGTLTENRMVVNECQSFIDEELLEQSMAVNSTAHLEYFDKENIRVIGNPTEAALLLYLNNQGKDYKALRESQTITERLPFNTERKFMATLASDSGERKYLYIKGAPEVVLSYCNLGDEARTKVEQTLRDWQQKAMRTLAFAELVIDGNSSKNIENLLRKKGLQLSGICAISDPIREEVPQAVETCLKAGINVKIVTGDTAGTAIEIARRIGLWNNDLPASAQTITGAEFADLTDEEALERVVALKVLSRAHPLDKQRLVRLLQKRGEVVAVTGDGTNDAPALNFAQVGLSMGSGTAVAKEASDITLIDDSFRSIVTAVMWGRSLYKNIQRFLGYQLTISLTAMIITLVGSLVCDEMPLTVTQILWINLIIDTFASLALSTIPPSIRVMKDKPRKATDFILSKSLVRNIAVTTICFCIIMLSLMFCYDSTLLTGIKDVISVKELTIIFTTFVLLQFWNLLNAKAWGSGRSAFAGLKTCKGLLLVLGIIAVCQVLIVCFGGDIFRVEPLSITTWCLLWGGTALVLLIGEIGRTVSRKKTESRN